MEPSTASSAAAEDGSPADRASLRAVLAQRDFRRYAAARFLATVTWQMLGVAVGWQVYDLTRDPLDLGLVGLAQFLPFLALVLPGGQAADRHDRRAVLAFAYATEVLAVAVLLAFTLSGGRETWPVFVAMALVGAGRAFWMPTGQAMVVNLVPPPLFPRAAAFNATLFQLAIIAGPALGGLLYAAGESHAGAGAAWVYASALALLAVVISQLMRVRPVRPPPSTAPHSWHELSAGLRFVFSRKPVLGAISLDLFAVLFGGATALLPMFAADILHVGPEGLGLLRTAPGIGAAVTAVLLARRPISRHAGRWMFGGVAVFGAATVVFGASTSFWLSFVALLCVGAGDMVSVFVRHLLVQLETPDAIRGRVSSVSAMFIGASNELGEFESGLTASWWGPVPAVVAGGLACLGVVGVYLRLFPQLRRLDRFPDPAHR
ncbi:MAG: MFS transporter [Gammaproteobacteria bacterium]|nr:MFS transporter [Gammaproteobacteria bacterium]